jgi:glutaryl-CoA dehydrogenase
VRRFVAELVLPDIAKWYEQGVFPREMAKEMGNR